MFSAYAPRLRWALAAKIAPATTPSVHSEPDNFGVSRSKGRPAIPLAATPIRLLRRNQTHPCPPPWFAYWNRRRSIGYGGFLSRRSRAPQLMIPHRMQTFAEAGRQLVDPAISSQHQDIPPELKTNHQASPADAGFGLFPAIPPSSNTVKIVRPCARAHACTLRPWEPPPESLFGDELCQQWHQTFVREGSARCSLTFTRPSVICSNCASFSDLNLFHIASWNLSRYMAGSSSTASCNKARISRRSFWRVSLANG